MNWFRKKKNQESGSITRQEWREHFMNLLEGEREKEETMEGDRDENEKAEGLEAEEEKNEEVEMESAADLNDQISDEEILGVVRKLKNNKAAGEDGITAEFIKNLPIEGIKELVEGVKEIWTHERIPKNWRTARIYPIFKKGDVDAVENYRGVSLLDVGYKILAMIMARRLSTWLERESKLTEGQAGFRRGRSTTEQIFILNTAIGNQLRNKGGKLNVAFVDLKKAFDKVDREILWEKTQKIGVNGKFLRMLKEIYRETNCEVITKEGMTENFQTKKGVRQGCPLSSVLFNIYINDLEETMRQRNEGGTAIGSAGTGVKIYVLMFADDLAILAEEEIDLQKMLKTLEKWARRNKMEVNTEKTKVMTFRKGGRKKKHKVVWKYGETALEEVAEFNYLGFWFRSKMQYNTHTRKVAGKLRQLINKAWGEARRAGISNLERKLFLMDMTVKAGAMYGVEIWGWQRREMIEKVQARYVKASMGLPRNTPNYIWKMEAGRGEIEIEAMRRSMGFLLKLANLDENRWAYKCMREEIRGILNKNPTYWGSSVIKALKEVGDGEVVKMVWNKRPIEKIERRIQEIMIIKKGQSLQRDWTKIDKSSYCDYYKTLKTDAEMEKYLKKDNLEEWQKVVWTRWRCGSAVRGGKKGYDNDKCRGCGRVTETIEHVTSCKKILEKLGEETRKFWQDERNKCSEDEWKIRLINKLKQRPNKNICAMLREISNVLKI